MAARKGIEPLAFGVTSRCSTTELTNRIPVARFGVAGGTRTHAYGGHIPGA